VKICWDNLEGMYLTRNGNLKRGKVIFVEKDGCKKCGESYLTTKNELSKYCSKSCAFSGRVFSRKTRKRMSKSGKLKRLSKEHKEKIAESMRGETNHFYGKKHSTLTRLKISKSLEGKNFGRDNHFYGKKHSEESKKKMSESSIGKTSGKNNFWYGKGYLKFGKNNPNWKGGVSCEPYCDAWADKEYKESIKERDGYRCLNPDCWGNCNYLPLTIHHIDYNKKNCHPSNLITLCVSCNSRANFNRNWYKFWYQAIIYRRYGNGHPHN